MKENHIFYKGIIEEFMKYKGFSFLFFNVKNRLKISKCLVVILVVAIMTGQLSMSVGKVYASDADTEIDIMDVEPVNAADMGLTCKSCVLMEASTGTVIYDKNMDEKVSPASITKIMTLLLIFEAIDSGMISLDDEVITSAYAKSMGGSQVFLEEGEKQTVETMIKCIVVASGNDASVAMAEYIAGTEAEFVNRMNIRASELGMVNTHFEDCTGLTDSDNHYTSAKDVAVMSRELIVNHKDIFKYSTIWMENITHVTDKGSSEFGLANTNKLLKQYPHTTGLKTGSTSKAKYCVSATADKDGIELIAVIMGAENYKLRFSEAESLFNYGYGICRLYSDKNEDTLENVKVKGGVKNEVSCKALGPFSYLSTDGTAVDGMEKKVSYEKEIAAPVEKGTVVGKIAYYLGGKEVGSVDIVATEKIEKSGFAHFFMKMLKELWL